VATRRRPALPGRFPVASVQAGAWLPTHSGGTAPVSHRLPFDRDAPQVSLWRPPVFFISGGPDGPRTPPAPPARRRRQLRLFHPSRLSTRARTPAASPASPRRQLRLFLPSLLSCRPCGTQASPAS